MTVNTLGQVVSWNDYSTFGMQLDNKNGNNGAAYDKYKFTGKERDIETNYDYFGARYYDSRIGRWLSVDPMTEVIPELSPYNYCRNNPVNRTDPNGMMDIDGDGVDDPQQNEDDEKKKEQQQQQQQQQQHDPSFWDYLIETGKEVMGWAKEWIKLIPNKQVKEFVGAVEKVEKIDKQREEANNPDPNNPVDYNKREDEVLNGDLSYINVSKNVKINPRVISKDHNNDSTSIIKTPFFEVYKKKKRNKRSYN